MKQTTLLLFSTVLGLAGCTTIGQQITNKNGTIAINQPPVTTPSSVVKVETAPKPIQQPQVKPVPAPKMTTIAPKPEPIIHEYEYQSRRVIGTYLVIQ